MSFGFDLGSYLDSQIQLAVPPLFGGTLRTPVRPPVKKDASDQPTRSVSPVKKRTRSSVNENTPKISEAKTLPREFLGLTLSKHLSTPTYQLFSYTSPKFISSDAHMLAFDGLGYRKKGARDYLYVLRGMECEVTHKVS